MAQRQPPALASRWGICDTPDHQDPSSFPVTVREHQASSGALATIKIVSVKPVSDVHSSGLSRPKCRDLNVIGVGYDLP
jgi:hypothetical protein